MNIFQRNVRKIVMLAVIAASFSSIFVKLTAMPPMAIGFFRLSFALPIFAVMAFVWHRDALKRLTKRQIFGCGIAGVCLAGHFFSWFTAVGFTSVASAAVLAMTHPIIILVISVLFFKDRPNKKAVVGVLMAFAGGVVISGGDSTASMTALFGDAMAILSALFMALYFIVGNKYRQDINTAIYVFLVFFFCWITFGIGMIATGTPALGYSSVDYLWVFAMAMVCQIGAHAVFNWCLGYTTPLYIATWEIAEAFIAAVLAAIMFAEAPTLWQICGGVLTLAGLVYYNFHETDNAKLSETGKE